MATDGLDSVLVVRACSVEDRFFPPLLAAQLLLDVRGLVHQDCYSRPVLPGGRGTKNGAARTARRWALAQEIYSNGGRGTESGHFLEHLVLETAMMVNTGRFRRFSAETSWNFREEPDVFRTRFFKMDLGIACEAVRRSAEVLARRGYLLDVGAPPR
jgi:hypothetical protein